MAWYRAGTVSVTNGNATVTGTGTEFVANVRAGYGIVLPDGKTYEVASVVSNTQLALATGYLGSTASGQPYGIFPTQSVISDLATQAAALLASFADVRDGIGAGLIPDGSAGTPALRFSADPDTGIYRSSGGSVIFVNDGVTRFAVTTSGVSISGGTISGTVPRTVSIPGGGHTLEMADVGSLIVNGGSGTRSVTLPPHSSVALPNYTMIDLIPMSAGAISVQRGSGVDLLYANANANRLVAAGSRAVLLKSLSNTWIIAGSGIS